MVKTYKIVLLMLNILLVTVYSVFADNTCGLTNPNLVRLRKKMIGENPKQIRNFCDDVIQKSSFNIRFSWPVDNCDFWISSMYGPRKHKGVVKVHRGVDLAATSGTLVKAAAPGKVIRADFDQVGYGNVIEILHKQGIVTRYGHLKDLYVEVGDKIAREEEIATVGATGNVRGKNDPSHLHFEIIDKHGKNIDPTPYLFCGELE